VNEAWTHKSNTMKNFASFFIMTSMFVKSCKSLKIGLRLPATYMSVRPMAMSITGIENPLSLVQPLLRPATTDLMKLMSR